MEMKLDINGAVRDVDASDDMPLLRVLRDLRQLNGTNAQGHGFAPCGRPTVRA